LYRRPVDGPEAPAVDQQRALSYGARAELYDRVRPCYPPQALAALLAALPAPPRRCGVAEVGAGTGKLTAVLTGRPRRRRRRTGRRDADSAHRASSHASGACRAGRTAAAGSGKRGRGGLWQLLALGRCRRRCPGSGPGTGIHRGAGHAVELRGRRHPVDQRTGTARRRLTSRPTHAVHAPGFPPGRGDSDSVVTPTRRGRNSPP
jgi:hypothetical protein